MYKTSTNLTPLLIFDGNCQAHHLAAIFRGGGMAQTLCLGEDYGFVPAYNSRGAEFTTPDEATAIVRQAREIGRKVYQVSQSTQMQTHLNAAYTDLVDKIVTFPFLQQYAITPAAFERVYKRNVDPARLLDLDLKMMHSLQIKAGAQFDFAGHLASAGISEPLFNTESHPRGFLTSRLFAEVARHIDEIDPSHVAAVVRDLETSEGINHVTVHPVDPSILERLGYDWGERYARYRDFVIAVSREDWQVVLNMAQDDAMDVRHDTQFLLGVAKATLHLNQLEGRGDLFKALTDLSPGFMHSWLLRNQYWQAVGDEAETRRCRIEMKGVLGNNRYYSQTRAWLEIQSGRYEDALKYGHDYLERSPDRADGIVPYAKALVLLGRLEDSKEVVYLFAKMRGAADVENIILNLSNLMELNIDPGHLRSTVN